MTTLTETAPLADHRTSNDDVADWRAMLLAELASQVERRDQCQATIDELTGQGDCDSILERELAEAGVVRAADTTASVRRAIDRLETGVFGRCSRCGDRIGADRLSAIPHAEFCVACPPHTSWLAS